MYIDNIKTEFINNNGNVEIYVDKKRVLKNVKIFTENNIYIFTHTNFKNIFSIYKKTNIHNYIDENFNILHNTKITTHKNYYIIENGDSYVYINDKLEYSSIDTDVYDSNDNVILFIHSPSLVFFYYDIFTKKTKVLSNEFKYNFKHNLFWIKDTNNYKLRNNLYKIEKC